MTERIYNDNGVSVYDHGDHLEVLAYSKELSWEQVDDLSRTLNTWLSDHA